MRSLLGILSLLWKIHIAVVFVLTAILFYPLILPLLFSESGKRKSFYLFVTWSWAVRILCFYFVKRKMKHPLPEEPHIIIANHASYLDIFLMYSIVPSTPFLFLGKSELLKYPLIKTYFKRLNIPVHRTNAIKAARSLVAASKEVKKGWSLVIFPEGGIPDVESPRLQPFKDGAFQLAKSLNIPIVPITFTNNYKLFSDPTKILGPARPGISHVFIHETIQPSAIENMTQEELKSYCFDTINGPILNKYPHFAQD